MTSHGRYICHIARDFGTYSCGALVQECYEHYGGGKSWFLELLAFHHPKHLFSNLGPSTHGSFTSPTLKFAANKDIIGMVLSKLKVSISHSGKVFS